MTPSTPQDVKQAKKMLFGSYPNGSPRDPEVYGLAVTGLLSKYPTDVIFRVCDPINGIPTKCSFLPTIAELSAALNDEMKPIWAALRHQKQLAQLPKPSTQTPEERARILAGMKELSAKLKRA